MAERLVRRPRPTMLSRLSALFALAQSLLLSAGKRAAAAAVSTTGDLMQRRAETRSASVCHVFLKDDIRQVCSLLPVHFPAGRWSRPQLPAHSAAIQLSQIEVVSISPPRNTSASQAPPPPPPAACSASATRGTSKSTQSKSYTRSGSGTAVVRKPGSGPVCPGAAAPSKASAAAA